MKKTITDMIIAALEAARDKGELALEKMPQVSVEEPKEAGHGDFATTVALQLTRQAKRPPREIAEMIKRNISDPDGAIKSIEIAGPGYLNFFLSAGAWHDVIREVEGHGRSFGHSHVGEGKKVQVEFVSANPTGPLHIGHGRGAAVGDSLCRLLAFTGFDVSREFYINDFGSQVENLGASIMMRCGQLAGDMGPGLVPDPETTENLYMGGYITEIAEEFMEDPVFVALPEEKKRVYCREDGIKRMLAQIENTLGMFGVRFDNWYSERTLYGPDKDLVAEAIAELKGKGLVYEEEGALWLRTTQFGDDKDRVMVRKNGQTTYFASDIAYHRDKYNRGFAEVIDIWGADHHGYVPRMKAAIGALGHDPETFKVLLVQLVNLVREGQPVKMSKRTGDFVTLDEVVEEVGADACRFTFLLRRSDSHLDFDLELVKRQSADNPVYYVQYAHARLCSVFRQADEKGVKIPSLEDVNLGMLSLPEELSIMKKLSAFPDLVEGAALALEPHRLTYYLQELAAELHSYYFKHRIISDDLALSHARMYLVKSVRTVVANALRLLGVTAPESM